MKTINGETYYSMPELIEKMDVSRNTLTAILDQGLLKSTNLTGGKIRRRFVAKKELERYLYNIT